MRLNKYIAQAGIASRRKADELISGGKVRVNGAVMDQLGYDVAPEDSVEVEGQAIAPAGQLVYIMLNKPVGYVTTVSDQFDRPTVMELVTDIDERLFPVGRLDYNSSGLLLLTNDGELAYHLTHPSHQVPKTYRVRVAEQLSPEKTARLEKGVDIGGFVTSPAQVKVIRQAERYAVAEVKIREGKNRQIRKMFDTVGNKVIELERTAIGELYLGRLKPGHYRKLTREEIEYLKNC